MERSIYRTVKALIAGAMVMGNLFFADESLAAQSVHQHQDGRTNNSDRASRTGKLLPPDGASVKILSPRKDQIFQTDQIPLEFRIVKGKRGHHVHAYVNGELIGMFNSQTGTLTGLKPVKHVLELRVVTEDHESELDAIDKVSFVVK